VTIAARANHVQDAMVDRGITLFTTPLANQDPARTPSTVIEDLLDYQAQTRGVGGRPVAAGSITYSLLAVLVGFYLAMRTNREVSEATAWTIVVHELTGDQRGRLGMTAELTGTRFDVIAAGLAPGATRSAKSAGVTATQQEYARFAKVFTAAIAPIDPSPFPRDRRLTSIERTAIANNTSHPQRRIPLGEVERNRDRMDAIFNKIIAAEARNAPDDGFIGDLATDETIVISHKTRKGIGSRPGKNYSRDPDTKFWSGKHDGDPERGFAYGITYAIRMGRPYGRPALNIPIGIHVGEATGGRPEAFASAHQYADLHGLTAPNRDRYAIADMGYTIKDSWVPTLLELGYKVNTGYPSNWSTDIEIPDVNAAGNPAPGPHIIGGALLCPGCAGVHASALTVPARGPAPESAKTIIKRQRTIDFLDALRMPIRNGLKRVKSPGGGRPKNGQAVLELWSITNQCPAALGLVNCANAPRADGLITLGVPDVPNPPFPGQPELWPRACTQESVTYRLETKTLKFLQAETHGSYYQEDMYQTMRAANERFHSQLKHPKSGGIADRNWVEIRGIAKRGLLFSIATAVTTGHMIDAFNPDEIPTNEREIERRRRSKILTALQRTPTVSAARKNNAA
jgi:hypothetical protein